MSTKAAVVAKPVFRSAARKRVTGRRELLFHFQNGASWSPVLSAADAAELRRRALKMQLTNQILKTVFSVSSSEPLMGAMAGALGGGEEAMKCHSFSRFT